MKRALTAIALLSLITGIAGCGNKEETPAPSSTGTSQTAEGTAAPEENRIPELLPGEDREHAAELSLNTLITASVSTKEGGWYTFTTSGAVNDTYSVTFLNQTPGTDRLYGVLLDENGNEIKHDYAVDSGKAVTLSASLKPETTYYVRLYPDRKETIQYVLNVKDEANTAGNVLGTGDEADTMAGEVRGGTNQADAVLLPLDTKVYGSASDKRSVWFAFTTTDRVNASYAVTFISRTLDTDRLYARLMDEKGNEIKSDYALDNGKANTLNARLEPETIYYIQIYPDRNETIRFMLRVKDPEAETAGVSTAGNLAEARGTSDVLEGKILPGTNQDDSVMIPYDTEVKGTLHDKHWQWFAFTTSDAVNEDYTISCINETPESDRVYFRLFDEYGGELETGYATNSGSAASYTKRLSEETVYYIGVYRENKYITDYRLFVTGPAAPETPQAEIVEKEPLVFEVPFELNETQVMFVANEAVFIDEAAAREALEPVAQVILDHPGHEVLIAGTTATIGTQEACAALSGKRAEAVKTMLISEFGVPEEQLLTVGLGYEKDPFVRGRDIGANGNFVETEAAKNRRVIVMDAADPTAKSLLGN